MKMRRPSQGVTWELDGKVYASYDLSYDATRNSGGVKASGRGFANGQVVSGYANGVWTDGDKVVMSVMMNDGSQNLEKIVTDPMTNEMTIHTYALKWISKWGSFGSLFHLTQYVQQGTDK